MDIFSNDLNSSMMYKGQHPDYALIVSLETEHSEFDSFWENPSIMKFISSKTIVVRLSQSENANDIQLFEYTFHHSSIPSLYIFGSNQASITHSWNDHFPTVEEFSHYFEGSTEQSEESNSTSLQQHNSSSNLMSPEHLQQFHNNEKSNESNDNESSINNNNASTNSSNHIPLKPPTSNFDQIKRPTPRAQPRQKSSLITTQVDRTNNNNQQEKSQKVTVARISVQGLTKTVNKTFPSNSTIGDLRSWIRSEFGRDLDLIIVHTHNQLPTDPSVTFAQADLIPSAVIRERDGGDATLRNDEDLNIGINERNHELANMNNNVNLNNIYEDENVVTNSPSSANTSGSSFNGNNNARQRNRTNENINGCGKLFKYFKLLIRMLNPWADDENENGDDLEGNIWEFRPNPNYMNSMLSQMNQDARQNVQQEDTWHPSRF